MPVSSDLTRVIKFDKKAKKRYTRTLAKIGRRTDALAAAGICWQTVVDHSKVDPAFAADCEAAIQTFRDHLEEEVYRRAVAGVMEPVYQGGRRVLEPILDASGTILLDEKGNPKVAPAYIRKFSDRLLELYSKRHIPEFRERHTVDVNTKGGVMVVPGVQKDIDWESQYGGDGDVIEGEVVEDNTKKITRGS